MKCFLDGNALCITDDDFDPQINDIMESDVVFITLSKMQIIQIKVLNGEDTV